MHAGLSGLGRAEAPKGVTGSRDIHDIACFNGESNEKLRREQDD